MCHLHHRFIILIYDEDVICSEVRIKMKDIFECSAQGDLEQIISLIRNKNNVNEANSEGHTALMYAAANGNAPIVSALIQAGATIDQAISYEFTALMYAVKHGHKACVEALIQAGADVTAEDNDGHTASAYATQQQHQDIIDVLSPTAREDVAQGMQGALELSVSSEALRTSDGAPASKADDESTLSKDQGVEQKPTNRPGASI